MAVRKSELALGYKSGIQATDLHSIASQEHSVLTGSLKTSQELTKNANLNKLGGARTEIIYFHQVPRDRNNCLVNINGLSDADPNLQQYVRINKFVVKLEAIDTAWEEPDNGGAKSPVFDGKITILPNTIQPYANDRYLLFYQGKTRLFKVTEATPVTADNQTAYELGSTLENNDFVYEGSQIENMVVDEYVFEENHIGTEFRTIFRKSEYETIYNLKYLYHGIGKVYIERFYNKNLNTYLLRYENNLKDDNEYVSSKFTILTPDGKEKPGTVINPIDDPFFASEYDGRDMYDSELIEFMLRNRIFDEEINFNHIIPTQFGKNRKPKAYNYTIFDALETKNRSKFKNKFQLPIELNTTSPVAQPVMFGKISLLHVATPAETTITLFPKKFPDIITATINDVIPALDYRAGNVYDKIVYMIALYINKYDRHITSFLLSIYNQLEELECFENSVLKNEVFYLYPIVGYIIKTVLQEYVDKETTNKYSDPRDHLPRKKER